MDKILQGLSFVVIYLDDILIHSVDASQHADHLRQVFHRLHSAGLTLKGSKCHIGMHSVSYLGHTFSASGMAPDPKKTQAIEQWPTPGNAKAVHQFLGLASYYRCYIKNFANIAAPLHHITESQAYDASTYQQQLQAKLAELQGFIETNLVEAAQAQKSGYDNQSRVTQFWKGDLVWLSNPTAGKLSPRWEGGWKIQEIKSPVTMKITNSHHSKVVHVNRLRHRIQFQAEEGEDRSQIREDASWNPPGIEHSIIPANTPECRYPSRDRHPPDRLRF